MYGVHICVCACMPVVCTRMCLCGVSTCVCVLPACMSGRMCLPGAHKVRSNTSDPLGQELRTIMSHLVDAGNRTWALWKSSQSL